jgi:hypothetical protein
VFYRENLENSRRLKTENDSHCIQLVRKRYEGEREYKQFLLENFENFFQI